MTSQSSKYQRRAFGLGMAGALLAWLLLWGLPGGREVSARIDRQIFDQLIRSEGGPPEREDFVLLGIDEAALNLAGVTEEELAESEVLGRMGARFPWDRRVWAEAVERLAGAGARLVVIDLVFGNPSDPEADRAFIEAVERHADRVVLTSLFAPVGTTEGGTEEFVLVEPMAELVATGARVGFVNFPIDMADGVCRRARFRSTLGRENGQPLEGEPEHLSLAGRIVEELGGEVPRDDRELRWTTEADRGGTAVYEPRSVHQIFVDELWRRNFDDGRFFEGKIVMIGPVAPRFQDIHGTPAGPLTGPQLHLQAAACGLAGAYLTPVAWGGWLALAAGLVSAWLTARLRRPLAAVACLVGLLAGLVALVVGGALLGSVLVPGFSAAVAFVIASWIGAQSFRLVVEQLERRRLRDQFRRFVSRDVADRLVRDPDEWRRLAQGNRRRVVVLFSDVRGFTSRSEQDDAEEVVKQLNEYLTAMVSVVFRHGGTLDKFIGDAVMAHWGALGEGDDATHARAALATAREMLGTLGDLNGKWTGEGRTPLKVGIGLHLGEVIAGELGSSERIEFGVIGDAVNLASRLEGLTKVFAADLIYSADVREAAADESGIPLGQVRVKGREGAAGLFAEGSAEAIRAAADRMPRGADGVIVMESK